MLKRLIDRDQSTQTNLAVRIVALVWGWVVLLKNIQREDFWWNPFRYLDLGIHELSHWVTLPLGYWISIPAGSIGQLALPVVIGLVLWKKHDAFGALFCMAWLSTSLLHVSEYARSAVTSELIMGRVGTIHFYHDWRWIFEKTNTLWMAQELAVFLWIVSIGLALSFVLLGSFLFYKRMTNPKERTTPWA